MHKLTVLLLAACAPLTPPHADLDPDPCRSATLTLSLHGDAYCGATLLSPFLAVTTAHCVDPHGVVGYGRTWLPAYPMARIGHYDGARDIAVLRLSEPEPMWGYLQLYREPHPGERVSVAGHHRATILSPSTWVRSETTADLRRLIQVDRRAYSGDSGYPLCDQFGGVVGICAGPSIEDQDQSYFIPAASIAAHLMEGEQPR